MTVCHRRKSPLWYLKGVLLIPSSTHISQGNMIISGACHRSSSLHCSPWHYSSMVPVAGDSIYAFYRTLPLCAQSEQGGYFVQFKMGYLQLCPGVWWNNHLIIKRFIYQIQRTQSPQMLVHVYDINWVTKNLTLFLVIVPCGSYEGE